MPQPSGLSPAAYEADGGTVGALLIHGLPGSAAETRPMGGYLAARGLTVRCPLLPGHGTVPQDLTAIRWKDWAGEVEAALDDLRGRCQSIFVGGLSMGSLLALWLGARHPGIYGLIVMAPAIKVLNRLLPLSVPLKYFFRYNPLGTAGDDDLGDPEAMERIWCYDQLAMRAASELYWLQRSVRGALPQIHQPVLIFQGRRDAQVAPDAPRLVLDGVSSTDKTLIWLENSGHNLLADGERGSVWATSYTWILEHVPPDIDDASPHS
jgi:carboxylesterase